MCTQSAVAGRTSRPFQVEVIFSSPPRDATISGVHTLLDLRQYPEVNMVGNTTAEVSGVKERGEWGVGGEGACPWLSCAISTGNH